MYNLDRILDKMSNEIGFRGESLSADNKKSNSGMFFQDASPLVEVSTINDVQNDAALTTIGLDALLTRMREQCVQQVLNKVLQGKTDFVLSNNLYPSEKTFKNTVSKRGKFVGFKLQPIHSRYIYSIPWVELCFDGVATFDIHLFNSNKPKAPLLTKSVTTVAGEATIVELDYIVGDGNDYKGGVFYLGYFDADLGEVSAYQKDYDAASLRVLSPYYMVEPIELNHEGLVIDVGTVYETSETCGLNIGVNVLNDFTDLVLNNKRMFWQALQHQMHEIVLLMIKYSRRSNLEQRLTSDIVSYVDFELFGNSDAKITGVQNKLNNEIENIRKALFRESRITRDTLKA